MCDLNLKNKCLILIQPPSQNCIDDQTRIVIYIFCNYMMMFPPGEFKCLIPLELYYSSKPETGNSNFNVTVLPETQLNHC